MAVEPDQGRGKQTLVFETAIDRRFDAAMVDCRLVEARNLARRDRREGADARMA